MVDSLASECLRTIYEYEVCILERVPELIIDQIKQYELKNDCGYLVSEY